MSFGEFYQGFAGLGKAYFDGLDQYTKKQSLSDLGSLASTGDYAGAAKLGFASGRPELGLGLLQLARETQASNEFSRLMGGGATQAAAPSTAPASPLPTLAGGGGQSMRMPADPAIRGKFIDTVKAGGLTNPHALAVVDAYGQAESGWNPGNVARTWSDPSQSGQPGTSGGLFSWRGPRLAAMQAATRGAEDPIAAQAKFFLTENPEVTIALQNAKSVDEAHQILANAWRFAGYDQPGQGEYQKRYNMARFLSRRYAGEQPASQPGVGGDQVAQADLPAQGSREVQQFTIPGDPSQIPLPANITQRMTQLRQASAIPGLPAAQRQAIQTEMSQLQQEAQQYRSNEYTRLREQERDQRREQRDDDRAVGGSPATRDFVIARRNGWTKAKNPTEYAAEQQAANPSMFDGKSVEGQALNHLVQQGILTRDQAADFAAGKTVTAPDGTIMFMTPRGVFGQRPDGTQVSVGPSAQGSANPPAPAPSQPAAPGMMPLTGPKVKEPTEGQYTSNTYVTRMESADKILSDPAVQAASMALTDRGAANVPYVGNHLVSTEYQKAEQAQRNFINAILRKESGAVINPDEFENARKQYFPQPGDSREVLAQKAQNRREVIEGMRQAAGPAYKGQPSQAQPAPSGRKPPPAVGTVSRGYRFLGGDPSQPSSWEPVGGGPRT